MERPLLRDITFYLAGVYYVFYIMYQRKIYTAQAVGMLILVLHIYMYTATASWIQIKFPGKISDKVSCVTVGARKTTLEFRAFVCFSLLLLLGYILHGAVIIICSCFYIIYLYDTHTASIANACNLNITSHTLATHTVLGFNVLHAFVGFSVLHTFLGFLLLYVAYVLVVVIGRLIRKRHQSALQRSLSSCSPVESTYPNTGMTSAAHD